MTNQWHFYVVTNTGAADFTNAAFITFNSDTLAIPRMGVFADSTADSTRPEADIDLYVAGPNDPNASSLTNLDPDGHFQLPGRSQRRRRVVKPWRHGICRLHQFRTR